MYEHAAAARPHKRIEAAFGVSERTAQRRLKLAREKDLAAFGATA